MRIIPRAERAERARQMDNAGASVRMEGLEPGKEAAAIFQRHVEGDLTLSEMGAALDALHDREYGPVRPPKDERTQKPA